MTSTATSTKTAIAEKMEWIERLRDGTVVHIRPIGPGDATREWAFLSHLPPEDRSYRFLGLIKGASKESALELTRIDPDTEVALVAIVKTGAGDVEVGVARYGVGPDRKHCDCAVTVDPQWQQRGVADLLMRRLIEVARVRGIRRMYAVDPVRCAGAHHLAERLGFHCRPDPEDPAVTTFELLLD
jgi:GNAT superfamily N-acetyltransferase